MQKKLTDAEWKVMEILWESSPRTMMEITNALKEETGWTKYTVMSFLKRMEEKGALYFEEGQEQAVVQESEDFLNKVFKGRIGLMVNAMVQQNAITEEDLKELQEILERKE